MQKFLLNLLLIRFYAIVVYICISLYLFPGRHLTQWTQHAYMAISFGAWTCCIYRIRIVVGRKGGGKFSLHTCKYRVGFQRLFLSYDYQIPAGRENIASVMFLHMVLLSNRSLEDRFRLEGIRFSQCIWTPYCRVFTVASDHLMRN